MDPSFFVPAEYFYALAADLPVLVTPETRYRMATLEDERQVRDLLRAAIDRGIISAPTDAAEFEPPEITPEQAARRLRALGSVAGFPEVDVPPAVAPAPPPTPPSPDVRLLVEQWLAYNNPALAEDPAEDIAAFWSTVTEALNLALARGHVRLALAVITQRPNVEDLLTRIADVLRVAPQTVQQFLDQFSVEDLAVITSAQWTLIFTGREDLLPDYTLPGSFDERVSAFIRHLKRFFDASSVSDTFSPDPGQGPPSLGVPLGDPLRAVLSAYLAGPHALGEEIDVGDLQAALNAVFPGDPRAQARLEAAFRALNELFIVTDIALPPYLNSPEPLSLPAAQFRFSLMEALYARGFTSRGAIQALTEPDFLDALVGTIAYDYAQAIQTRAGGSTAAEGQGEESARAINANRGLVHCVPPAHRSPLGPVAYLQELLMLSGVSTCAVPFTEAQTLSELVAERRGPLASLLVTRANLETPLPVIDLVNECLEAKLAGAPGGVVHETNAVALAGHTLLPGLPSPGRNAHEPATLFGALPEHSTPQTPVALPFAYDPLRSDFSAPSLPYSQPLDVCRSHLQPLHTSRFEMMRHFRRKITEFVLAPDPSGAPAEPAEFRAHLWRLPVRVEIAREYLGISPEEATSIFGSDFPDEAESGLDLRQLFGVSPASDESWPSTVLVLSSFLARTGLSYCDLVDLLRSGWAGVQLSDGEVAVEPPECEPCCLDDFVLRAGPFTARVTLRRLAVFLRLWRKLQLLPGARYSFTELADMAEVLQLFYPESAPPELRGKINPDFLRQLAAFQMLRDELALPLVDPCDEPPAEGFTATGASRTHLLALWVARGTPAARKRHWAIGELLERLRHFGCARYRCQLRPPEFLKLLADHLDPLSRLAGFDVAPATTSWDAHPTHTLRFAEVLGKICASSFSVGELLFLFTAEQELPGDDPFPLASRNESRESPLDLPDDDRRFSLWELRRKLLAARVSDEDVGCRSWAEIQASLRSDFGFASAGSEPLQTFAEHFFPRVLRHIDALKRQYRVPLAGTPPLMWNTPPAGPFRYDESTSELWTELPLRDEAVIQKLSRVKPLNAEERRAVQDLYFAPRVELASLAFLFPNLNEAEARLIEEPDELARWRYFQHSFALAFARSRIIAEHLAAHVSSVTGSPNHEGHGLAWKLLQHLLADENKATGGLWELPSGDRPEVTWFPAAPPRPGAPPIGGAFSALLGLVGTGLAGEIRPSGADVLLFRELRGPLDAFGELRNRYNAPFPTSMPELAFELSAAQLRFVGIRNGFALDNDDADRLGGAEGFCITWRGVLLVEGSGSYEFQAGAPTPDGEPPSLEGSACQCWKVTLAQGQRSWVVLSHEGSGKEAHSLRATPLTLKRGAYDLTVSFQQRPPVFDRDDVKPARTGFQLKYTGPDTDHCLVAIPACRLYIAFKDLAHPTLDDGVSFPVAGATAAREFLRRIYTSSLRDIRRTYQRAFKALLFAQRMGLSAKPISDFAQSEIGYLLEPEHRGDFAGQAFELVGSVYQPRPAFFDFNLLPVSDDYFAPAASEDQRVAPSLPRQQALFDWWERLFDYTVLRADVRTASEAPAWLLFHEAAENHPDDPAHILRHLGVDLAHAASRGSLPGLVLRYYDAPGVSFDVPTVRSEEFEDEQWAIRVWRADQLLRAILRQFTVHDLREARPDLWAANDPATESGNENLTRFVREGLIENGEPVRYEDLKALNDGLRERGRAAAVAYLTALDRLQDPSGEPVRRSEQLSELFLIDVNAGLCQRASRVEQAVSAVQTFVQRARLGLEPSLSPSADFNLLYDRRFATFQLWQACRRGELYRENRIEAELLEDARRSESFRFLEDQLRHSTLTLAAPAGQSAWNGPRPPSRAGLALLQAREPSLLQRLPAPKPGLVGREGFTLLGEPERHARPSWLATTPVPSAAEQPALTTNKLPYWVESAIRLGAKFVRVAAAGLPTGAAVHDGPASAAGQECCTECGVTHPPAVDEYYFWLVDSRHFTSRRQDADISSVLGTPEGDATGGGVGPWHDPGQLPRLLAWQSEPMVHLFWARVHNGELGQPRRSHEGVQIDRSSAQEPELVFLGRFGDSLHFRVLAGMRPVGYVAAEPGEETLKPGFRYDLASDRAEVMPPAVADAALPPQPAGLPAHPYFVLFEPGAPLIPPSFFSQALSIAGVLRSHCRFEAALAWYRQFFDPLQGDAAWCAPVEIGDGASVLPACCEGGPVPREQAQRRAVTLSYLETLLEWADATLRRHSPEAFEQARVILDAAARILGETPRHIAGESADSALGVGDFDFASVSPPLNPRLLALYERVNDRLDLVHRCQSAGRLPLGLPKRDMPYFGDLQVRNGWESSAATCLDDEDWCAPACAYRFNFLIQKATELAADVRGLGTALLSAYQSGDAEYLASLRSTHERQLLELTTTIRQNQWRESDWQVQSLYKTKEGAQTRLAYFQALIVRGLIGGESSYRDLTIASTASRTAGNVSQAIGQVMNLIPDLYLGFPCNQVQPPVGSKLANVFSAIATIANTVADVLSSTAGLRLTEAGWQRREDEWRHQVDVITIEIEQIERQINAAKRRRDIALRELNNYQRQLEQSAELHDFLRDKFTSHQLFVWLQRETSALHRQAFELAFQLARQAERAFNYERGHKSRRFLDGELWNDLHEGLLAGERLSLALKTMEKAYLDDNHREYELTKHVSLRQLLPLQLLRLKRTGACEIELPEWLFDLDYPGHYLRRIRNLSLSIPSVIGPFSGVHCRLTLVSSATRIDPRLGIPRSVCCEHGAPPEPHPHACACCGHVLQPAPRRPLPRKALQSGYAELPDDPRIVRRAGSVEAIATSSAQNDAGLFELNFRDERYLPFEFAGAVSRFRLELPPENNYFDLATVTDVILHINYTAREGGAALRTAAAELARARLPDAGERVIDVRLELPDVWQRLAAMAPHSRRALELRLDREFFPFLPGQPALRVTRLELLFETAHGPGQAQPAAHIVELSLPERGDCTHDAACQGPTRLIQCAASERWPELYDGAVLLSLGPISERGAGPVLTLTFPRGAHALTDLFLVVSYSTADTSFRTSTSGRRTP
ncbi:MAG TPA: neuraminidase-like domain-containing protein [Polyangiaceae bacterium]|nr:neuraminidase-like domain-containing protein [Polyangiaceae bacterium]